jgi:hypothetical protein
VAPSVFHSQQYNVKIDRRTCSPRDGKNITLPQVEAALMTALHMTGTIAHALAGSLRPILREDGTFDLVHTRQHNMVEHDRSFTRRDFRQGDNYTMQPDSKALPPTPL